MEISAMDFDKASRERSRLNNLFELEKERESIQTMHYSFEPMNQVNDM
jgi:uncharacterized membrane protein